MVNESRNCSWWKNKLWTAIPDRRELPRRNLHDTIVHLQAEKSFEDIQSNSTYRTRDNGENVENKKSSNSGRYRISYGKCATGAHSWLCVYRIPKWGKPWSLIFFEDFSVEPGVSTYEEHDENVSGNVTLPQVPLFPTGQKMSHNVTLWHICLKMYSHDDRDLLRENWTSNGAFVDRKTWENL